MNRENIVLRKLRNKVILDGRIISEIFFDLKHINYGWDQEKRDYKEGLPRQNLTENDVVSFFEQLNYLRLIPRPQETFLKSVEKRFVFNVYDENRKYRMVVDFMKNEITVVVTIY